MSAEPPFPPEIKIALLGQIYDVAIAITESFECDALIGPDLAYFVGAVVHDTQCSWPADRPFVVGLRAALPPDSPA